MRRTPPPGVLVAFQLPDGSAVPLNGGQGRAWRVGNTVLKPADLSAQELEWQAEILPRLHCPEVRLAAPLRATDGSLIVQGWTAWPLLSGQHEPARWLEIIHAGETFHRATALLNKPDFLRGRNHRWAQADRMAWGEQPLLEGPYTLETAELLGYLKPVTAPNQLIHGDLTGNVLLSQEYPPAIIDLSLYWRPADYGTAIVVADAMIWQGADDHLLRQVATGRPEFVQCFLRALLFRRLTEELVGLRPSQEYVRLTRLACEIA